MKNIIIGKQKTNISLCPQIPHSHSSPPCGGREVGVGSHLALINLKENATESPWVSHSHPQKSQVGSFRHCVVEQDWRGGCIQPLLKTALHMPGIPPDHTTWHKQMRSWWKDFTQVCFLQETTAVSLNLMTFFTLTALTWLQFVKKNKKAHLRSWGVFLFLFFSQSL